ncbi:MAG: hypothetical protein FJX22_01690, partial [Alphaproteobacteria bacterium]|nr:hypothetical protein [Alphaproteobacteria bacterium]
TDSLPRWEQLLPPAIPLTALAELNSPPPALVQAAARLSAVPAPNPEPLHRPRQLSASQLQQLMTDPYGFYAANLLKLHPRPSFDDEAQVPPSLGNLLHQNLERFSLMHGTLWPDDAPQRLLTQIAETLGTLAEHPMMACYWQRLTDAVAWLDAMEIRLRMPPNPLLAKVLVEKTANATVTIDGHSIQLRARADRINVDGDGGVTLVDYKTGSLPTARLVMRGRALQLPLEAWLLQQGGFGAELANTHLRDCAIWRLNGGNRGGQLLSFAHTKTIKLDILLAEFEGGVHNLLHHLLLSPTPFYPDPWPESPRANDYAHLKRRANWI